MLKFESRLSIGLVALEVVDLPNHGFGSNTIKPHTTLHRGLVAIEGSLASSFRTSSITCHQKIKGHLNAFPFSANVNSVVGTSYSSGDPLIRNVFLPS
jgi:hypothetical protein